MFADKFLYTQNTAIAQTAEQIQELEAQLAALREKQTALEAELQAMQTLAGAGQSAIDQARKFLAIAASRPDLITAFWEELDTLRTTPTPVDVAILPPAPEPSDDDSDPVDPTPEPAPSDDNDPVVPTPDPSDDDSDPIPGTDPIEEAMAAIYHPEAKALLSKFSMSIIRNVAKRYGVSTNGTKAMIIHRLTA